MLKRQYTKLLSVLTFLFISSGCTDINNALDNILSDPAEHNYVSKTDFDFQIEECTFSYKGKTLDFSQTIEDWESILGPVRATKVTPDSYVWDAHGFRLLAEGKNHAPSSVTFVFYDYLPFSEKDIRAAYGEKDKQDVLLMNAARPSETFTSSIWFNGAEISPIWDLQKVNDQMQSYNEDNTVKFREAYASTIFAAYKRCDPDKYPKYGNQEMIFRIDVEQHDQTLIQKFSFGIRVK